MTTNILGTTPRQFQKMLARRIQQCVIIAGITLVISILLAVFHRSELHNLFLIINICLDLGVGFFLIYYIQEKILPQRRLHSLFSANTEQVEDTITDILQETQHYRGLDCQIICLGERRLFLPTGTISLQIGARISAHIAYNVILEVTQ